MPGCRARPTAACCGRCSSRASTACCCSYPARAAELGVPTVVLEEASPDEGTQMSVTADNRDGARRLADHLIAAGHTRIAFIAARQPWPMVEQRQLGYREALAAAGIEHNPDFELF